MFLTLPQLEKVECTKCAEHNSVGVCGWATHQQRRAFQEKEQRFLPGAWCKAGLFLVTVQIFGSEAEFYQLPKKGLTCGLDLMAEVFFM